MGSTFSNDLIKFCACGGGERCGPLARATHEAGTPNIFPTAPPTGDSDGEVKTSTAVGAMSRRRVSGRSAPQDIVYHAVFLLGLFPHGEALPQHILGVQAVVTVQASRKPAP